MPIAFTLSPQTMLTSSFDSTQDDREALERSKGRRPSTSRGGWEHTVRVIHDTWQEQIGTMDMELKGFFVEQQSFISDALQSLEKRLGSRFDRLEGRVGKLEARFDRFERDTKIAFQVMDARLSRVEASLAGINRRLGGIERQLRETNKLLRTLTRAAKSA